MAAFLATDRTLLLGWPFFLVIDHMQNWNVLRPMMYHEAGLQVEYGRKESNLHEQTPGGHREKAQRPL